jgi:SAM-dependent methyltransferase
MIDLRFSTRMKSIDMSSVCLVCGAGYRPSQLPGLLACEACDFTTADVTLSRAQLEELYSAAYFAGGEYKDYLSERPMIEKHFRIRLKKLLEYVPGPASKRLFEIGCAYGFFLSVARPRFASAAGIDISRDAAEYAAGTLGLDVRAGDFSQYEFPERPDVVCLWDTVEHLARPDLYIEKIARNMNPGGIVSLTTGDIGSLVARFRGKRWRQIHPPTHLHYFSKATLIRLLERCGFRVRYCGYEGVYRSADTMAYMILALRHGRPGLHAALKRMGVLDWNLYLNLRDIVFIIAERQ